MDSGSTHNFLDSPLAAKLSIRTDNPKQMDFIVDNGEKLRSEGSYGNFMWIVQGNQLTIDFHLLPLREYDMVLDIHWMHTLGLYGTF